MTKKMEKTFVGKSDPDAEFFRIEIISLSHQKPKNDWEKYNKMKMRNLCHICKKNPPMTFLKLYGFPYTPGKMDAPMAAGKCLDTGKAPRANTGVAG